MMKRFLQKLGSQPSAADMDPVPEPEPSGPTRLGRIVKRGNSDDYDGDPGAPQSRVKRIFKA